MKVKELIEALQSMPQDAEVYQDGFDDSIVKVHRVYLDARNYIVFTDSREE